MVLSLRFTGSNSWHTYAYSFITANLTYKGMLPIHCMQASCGEMHHRTYYIMITMNNNADSLYNLVWLQKDYTHTSCRQITS